VQALPGGDVDAVREVQHFLRSGRLFERLAEGEETALGLIADLSMLQPVEVVEEKREIRFLCRCSDRRIDDMLQLLTTVDLDEMIAEGKPSEITCNFCNRKFLVESASLERIRTRIAGPRQPN
jgi:molecular chaperone Hsp33